MAYRTFHVGRHIEENCVIRPSISVSHSLLFEVCIEENFRTCTYVTLGSSGLDLPDESSLAGWKELKTISAHIRKQYSRRGDGFTCS